MPGEAYTVEFAPRAAKELRNLERPDQVRVAARIDSLAQNPRPRGVEKLSGEEDLYRVRVGNYRIIYQIQDARLLVLVVKIGHRRDVYRKR
jgi:mRNA interferase RelE/StbE